MVGDPMPSIGLGVLATRPKNTTAAPDTESATAVVDQVASPRQPQPKGSGYRGDRDD
ncbi:MAG: hypothetical protein AVDCRST_MAG33-1483 [uncultured Thermomicrobiales bacterium]|uniref:Uncharacterized protein n=1 Tax=uncultured Thermomicrobiales bacterium TaxID=1645740 RepID=A0A6J4URR6_9BACT|nr:MAG: hypothetical protein AVDCRST_MAG33-1483 [uncultured Thermomicrobiales bacterium]